MGKSTIITVNNTEIYGGKQYIEADWEYLEGVIFVKLDENGKLIDFAEQMDNIQNEGWQMVFSFKQFTPDPKLWAFDIKFRRLVNYSPADKKFTDSRKKMN